MRSKPKPASLAVAGAVVVLAGVGVWASCRPKPLSWHAARVTQCALDGDSGCLWGYLGSDERGQTTLTRESFDRFIKEYVRPHMGATEGEMQITGTDDQPTLVAFKRMRTPSGKHNGFGLSVARTDEDVKSPALITEIVLWVWHEKYYRELYGMSLDKLTAWQEGALKDRAMLESYGIMGLYRSPEEGVLTWDEWIDLGEQRIARTRRAMESK